MILAFVEQVRKDARSLTPVSYVKQSCRSRNRKSQCWPVLALENLSSTACPSLKNPVLACFSPAFHQKKFFAAENRKFPVILRQLCQTCNVTNGLDVGAQSLARPASRQNSFLACLLNFFTNRKSLWRHDLLGFEAKSYLQQLLVGSNFLLGTFGVFEGPKKNLDSRPAKPPCD